MPVEMYRCGKRFQLDETSLKKGRLNGDLIQEGKKKKMFYIQVSVCLPGKKFNQIYLFQTSLMSVKRHDQLNQPNIFPSYRKQKTHSTGNAGFTPHGIRFGCLIRTSVSFWVRVKSINWTMPRINYFYLFCWMISIIAVF